MIKFTLATILGGSAAQLTKYVISPYVNMTKFEGVFIQLCHLSQLYRQGAVEDFVPEECANKFSAPIMINALRGKKPHNFSH